MANDAGQGIARGQGLGDRDVAPQPMCESFEHHEARPGILIGGSWLCVVFGLLGLALGMEAVSAHYGRFDDPTAALGTGLGELANNGSFAAILALLLGAASLVTKRMSRGATA